MCACFGVTETNEETIGFTASTATNQYEQTEIIRFNDTFSNIGGYFNSNTSSFLCPVDGLYFFSVMFNAQAGKQANLSLMLNGLYLGAAFADNAESLNSHASALTVTSCYSGQTVWVMCNSAPCSIYDGSARSQFAGALLCPY